MDAVFIDVSGLGGRSFGKSRALSSHDAAQRGIATSPLPEPPSSTAGAVPAAPATVRVRRRLLAGRGSAGAEGDSGRQVSFG